MPVVQTLTGRVAEIAPGMSVRRLLPAAAQRSVGPFVFFDHFGPVEPSATSNADVGPHPHVGLATVTYLLAGEMVHRDSVGSVQTIRPGDINWMTAGRGVVHSERIPVSLPAENRRLEGLQLWVALPEDKEEGDPTFQHVADTEIPRVEVDGVPVRVLVGSAFGHTSPVSTASPTLYLDVALPAGRTMRLPGNGQQLAVYPLGTRLRVDGVPIEPRTMAVLEPAVEAHLWCEGGCRLVVIGGDALAKPPHMWWNFVSTSPDRIEQAAKRWEARAFPAIPGETALLPMPPFRRPRG